MAEASICHRQQPWLTHARGAVLKRGSWELLQWWQPEGIIEIQKGESDTRSIGALVLGDEARLHGHGLRAQSSKVKFELASMTYLKFGEAFTVRLKVL